MNKNICGWGTLPPGIDVGANRINKASPKKRVGKRRIPDHKILAVYADKGRITSKQAKEKHGVSVSTANAIWRKAVRKDLLEGL